MDDSLAAARAALARVFGYPDFRGRQAEAVATVLHGRDLLVLMPTGGGKSLCFQVPALLLPGLTLVISPLISLMKDQVDALCRRGVAAALLNSTLSTEESALVQARARAGELRLLYVAPERMDSSTFQSLLGELRISLLAVDEAHCISQWGHEFRPAYRRLGRLRAQLECPCVALTATATPPVRVDIMEQLGLREPLVLAGGFDRPNLSWHVLPAPTAAWKDRALVALLKRQREGAIVVYAGTRRVVDALADYCNGCGIPAAAYHAGMAPPERLRLQDAFMGNHVRVIFATTAFGMGVDKPDVRLVVHYTLSSSLEGYYQEAGRAGRDGAPARCVVLHAPADALLHEFMIDQSQPDAEIVRAVCAALVRLAGPDDLVQADFRTLAAAATVTVNEKQAEAVVRRCRAAGLLEARRDEGPWRLRTRADPPPLDWAEVRAGRLREQHRLAAMQGYLAERGCRRRYLLRYYGEEAPERCQGCDRCLGEAGTLLPGWSPARSSSSGWRAWLRRILR